MRMKNVLSLFVLCSLIFAAVPKKVNFQAKITDATGVAIDGTRAMEFRIFNAATGGSALWTESHAAITVTKGLFDVVLGNITPLNLPFDVPYYVEIVVASEVLSPRVPLSAAPYSFRAAYADSCATADVTSVTAGTGLTGGGTSGDITLSLATPVSISNGGTNASSYTANQFLWYDGTRFASSGYSNTSFIQNQFASAQVANFFINGYASTNNITPSTRYGFASQSTPGASGSSWAPSGIYAGVYGKVYGSHTTHAGVYGSSETNLGPNAAVMGYSSNVAISPNTTWGALGYVEISNGNNWAGYFSGNLASTGYLNIQNIAAPATGNRLYASGGHLYWDGTQLDVAPGSGYIQNLGAGLTPQTAQWRIQGNPISLDTETLTVVRSRPATWASDAVVHGNITTIGTVADGAGVAYYGTVDANYSSYTGMANFTGAAINCWDASGSASGGNGSVTISSLATYDAIYGATAYGLSGTASGTSLTPYSSAGSNRVAVAGVLADLTGTINTYSGSAPDTFRVAALWAIDRSTGTAPHWAGYFDGNVTSTGYLNLQNMTAPTAGNRLYASGGNLYWDGVLLNGGTMPSGTSGQTIRHNGTGWISNSFLYNDGSKIGIGTTTPTARFEVSGSGATIVGSPENLNLLATFAAGSGAVSIGTGTGTTAGYVWTGAGMPLVFSTGPTTPGSITERMRIDNTGNVGIGTTTPASKLAVNGSGNALYNVFSYNSSTAHSSVAIFGEQTSAALATSHVYGVRGLATPSASGGYHYGVRGDAYFSTATSACRTYGVYGYAGNASTGYNYGLYGYLMGTNAGAAVFGTLTGDVAISGLWAGYFAGNLSSTGYINIQNMTPPAAGNRLYASGGNLYWDGTLLNGVGGGGEWEDAGVYKRVIGNDNIRAYEASQNYGFYASLPYTASGTYTGIYSNVTGSNTSTGYGLFTYSGVYSGGGMGGTYYGINATAEWGNDSYGIYGASVNAIANSYGVYGYATNASTYSANVYGVYGNATASLGTKYGVYASADNTGTANYALYGTATGASTTNYGIYATASGATTNWAGYFVGNGYFSGNLGINTTTPTYRLHVLSSGSATPIYAYKTTASGDEAAVMGVSDTRNFGYLGGTRSTATEPFGSFNYGVYGRVQNTGWGGFGGMFYNTGGNWAALAGDAGIGYDYAAFFNGNVNIAPNTGTYATGKFLMKEYPVYIQSAGGHSTYSIPTNAVTLTDDSYSAAISLGFTFNFYGTDYTQVYISSNGYLTFTAGSAILSNTSLPSSSVPYPAIFGLWDDLNPSSGGSVVYQTYGTSPHQIFVVQFTAVPFFGSSEYRTFQIKLYEQSNMIEVTWGWENDLTWSERELGSSATIGIQAGSTGPHVAYSYDAPVLPWLESDWQNGVTWTPIQQNRP